MGLSDGPCVPGTGNRGARAWRLWAPAWSCPRAGAPSPTLRFAPSSSKVRRARPDGGWGARGRRPPRAGGGSGTQGPTYRGRRASSGGAEPPLRGGGRAPAASARNFVPVQAEPAPPGPGSAPSPGKAAGSGGRRGPAPGFARGEKRRQAGAVLPSEGASGRGCLASSRPARAGERRRIPEPRPRRPGAPSSSASSSSPHPAPTSAGPQLGDRWRTWRSSGCAPAGPRVEEGGRGRSRVGRGPPSPPGNLALRDPSKGLCSGAAPRPAPPGGLARAAGSPPPPGEAGRSSGHGGWMGGGAAAWRSRGCLLGGTPLAARAPTISAQEAQVTVPQAPRGRNTPSLTREGRSGPRGPAEAPA